MRYTRVTKGRGDGGVRALAAFVFALAVLTPVAAASAQNATPQDATPQPTTTFPTGRGGKITGLIINRLGDTLILRNDGAQGISWVTLNSGTSVYSPSGFLNVSRKGQDRAQLVPGLIVKVYGHGTADGNLAADRISFHKSAEKVAAQISAGEVDLKARAEANSDSIADAKARARNAVEAINARVSNLDNYDVKDRSVVTFATGSAELDESAKATLSDVVSRNKGLTGFIVEVNGYADATGPAELNKRLSQQRANAVATYLTDVSSVPVRRIPSPRGFGTASPVATNDTAEGRAENRRVEIRVLVNKGLSGSR